MYISLTVLQLQVYLYNYNNDVDTIIIKFHHNLGKGPHLK